MLLGVDKKHIEESQEYPLLGDILFHNKLADLIAKSSINIKGYKIPEPDKCLCGQCEKCLCHKPECG